MAANINVQNQIKAYEKDIQTYTKNRGHFICVSDDGNFTSLLRNMLIKHLELPTEVLSITPDSDHTLRMVRDAVARCSHPVLFLERILDKCDMSPLVRQLKNAFTDLRIIILTTETSQNYLILLHEIGADNFITKPISMNGLLEKIAFTLKPQSKLGQLIEVARTYLSKGQPKEALTTCSQVLEMKANSPAAYLIIGDAFRAMQKYDRACQAYEEAHRHEPMYLDPLRKLASLHGEQGNTSKQLYYLEKLDTLSPLNVERKIDMGELHFDLGNKNAATNFFDNAIQIATKDAMNHIGEVATRVASICEKKDPAQSEQYLRYALSIKGKNLDSTDITTYNRLGILLRNQGKWQEALAEYEKALRLNTDDPNIYYNMAMACAEGKDFANAQKYLGQAIALQPDFAQHNATIAYNIGQIFLRAGSVPKAMQYYEQALTVNPEYTPAIEALRQLRECM